MGEDQNLWWSDLGGAHQLLDNHEVYSVLAYIARPNLTLERDTWLGQSVWDSASCAKLKNNRTSIQTYIDYYVLAWSNYRERYSATAIRRNTSRLM